MMAPPRSLLEPVQKTLLYHFCRLRLPSVSLGHTAFEHHLRRAIELYHAHQQREKQPASWPHFLDNLFAVDWFLSCACLEGDGKAWEVLFSQRASRVDCLLVDALRARAVRLFPGNEEKQDSAVSDFWGYLIAGERTGSPSILARYDGQRPLVPWLIRVFQNKHISDLRRRHGMQSLPEDDLDNRDLPLPETGDERWHDEFRQAAREWLTTLKDGELIVLGLRMRYRMSQREVAALLGIHEGNVSRQTTKLRDHCLEEIGQKLREAGWTGDDLDTFIFTEMASLLMDDPRLSADHLAALLSRKGKDLPIEVSQTAAE